jgi:MEMO1 family protein
MTTTQTLTDEQKKTLLTLARDALAARVGGKPFPEETGYQLDDRLRQNSGAFVTLHKQGQLRGCIGYIEPVAQLFRSIMDNAESAALHDTRFHPVTPPELTEIDIEISVLTVPQRVAGYQNIVIGTHGMILKKGWARAVFLPQVAPEQGWNLEETLSHLSMKAGLQPAAWRTDAEFSVFEAIVFDESQFKLGRFADR